jgi:DNA processing protein
LNETDALVALTHTQFLGSIRVRLLVKYFGSALAVLEADSREIESLPGFGEKLSRSLSKCIEGSEWRRDIELANRYSTAIIPFYDPRYPRLLLEIPDFPPVLYVKGTLQAGDKQGIAVVGTRNAGIYGMEMAERLSHDLASLSFTVVSGLARGVDTAVHCGALQTGRTLAVLGSGIANIYPSENRGLAERIASQGAVMSELPMTALPDRRHFPRRNRLVSGMTMGTVLIEAPEKSGAMITMERAYGQGRKLFVLPGRADNPNFRGNHSLIKKGFAKLVENARDIADSFQDLFGFSTEVIERKRQGLPLESEEKNLLAKMPDEELTVEELIRVTNTPIVRLNVLLMSLVLKKWLKEFPGKIYKKI